MPCVLPRAVFFQHFKVAEKLMEKNIILWQNPCSNKEILICVEEISAWSALIPYGGVHKRRPQLGGGEGVEECVTECDSRGRGCRGQWDVLM